MKLKTEVVFRVMGDFFDATTLTRIFEMTPMEAYGKGDVVLKHPERHYPNGYWEVTSGLGDEVGLSEHLRTVISLLETKRDAIENVKKSGYSCDIFCGIFSEDDLEASVALAPDILFGIGKLGLSLTLHYYLSCVE